jgi:ectoine hydroxylase
MKEGGQMDVVDTYRLTGDERRRMESDGYVLRERVFDAGEVARITAACESLVDDLVKDRVQRRVTVGSYVFDSDRDRGVTIKWEGSSDVVHGIEPFAHLSPVLEGWGYDPRFVGPMVDFVGDPQPALFTEKLNLKRPHHGGVNPLHQDYPYWEGFADDATRIATAMLFLDAASTENGTLQVVPGSHRRGKWPTRSDKDAFGNLEIDPAEENGTTAVALDVPAGTVVFFGPFLVHKSAPNTSDKERRSLLYSYQPAGFATMRELWLRRDAAAERDERQGTRMEPATNPRRS